MSNPYLPPEEDPYEEYPELQHSPPADSAGPVRVQVPDVTPVVVYVLLAITIGVFLLQMGSEAIYGQDIPTLLGVKSNELIVRGQWWRLFTPMLLHGGLLHIGFNMYALYIFGPGLERHYGHIRFLALYLLAGFAGNVVSFLFTPEPSLGASTAIFGLLGAEGIFLYRNQELFGGRARQALTNIIIIGLFNLVWGLQPGIDNWGHIGGLIGGSLFAWLAGPVLRIEGIPPLLQLVDGRPNGQALLGGLVVGLLFTVLAVAGFYLRT